MKRSYAEGYSYHLTKKDVMDIPEFEDRDILEIDPQILVLKSGPKGSKYFQVFIQLGTGCARQVLCFFTSKNNSYPFEQTYDGIISYVIKMLKHGIINWCELMQEYDDNYESYEDYIRRISDEA